jgi:hypothetical protein
VGVVRGVGVPALAGLQVFRLKAVLQLTSVLCPLSSVFCPLSSVFCPLPKRYGPAGLWSRRPWERVALRGAGGGSGLRAFPKPSGEFILDAKSSRR